MAAMTYLLRLKSGTYHFRRAVPAELQPIVGKTAIKQTLRTKDCATAKVRALVVAAQAEAELAAARGRLAAPTRSELSDADIEELRSDYLHQRLAADEAHRTYGSREDDELYKALKAQFEAVAESEGWEEGSWSSRYSDAEATAEVGLSERAFQKTQEALEYTLPSLKAMRARGDTHIIKDDVDTFLHIHGINLDPTSASYRKLSVAFLNTAIEANEAVALRQAGELVNTPPPPAKLPTPSQQPTEEWQNGILVLDLFDRWVAERNPASKTISEYRTAFRRFTELHGNMHAHAITRPHIREYKDALRRTPSRCSEAVRKLPLPALLEHLHTAAAPTGPTLSAGSINKALGGIETVLNWADRQGYMDAQSNWSNPAANMKMHDPATQQDGRLPYDSGDLSLIFQSPVFRDAKRPLGGAGEAAKWLPLIGLFSGARLEEIGQALVSDVKEQDGVRYLDINTVDREAGKRLKNKNSRRKIPLHPELIRCGLLRYVEERRAAGDERLFPALQRATNGQLTGNWSKWWGRHTEKLGITDHRKVFHSFRHGFKRACVAAGVEEEVHDALTGHTNTSIGRAYGGPDRVPIERLYEAIQKVSYKGLDLRHVYVD